MRSYLWRRRTDVPNHIFTGHVLNEHCIDASPQIIVNDECREPVT